MTPTPHGSRGWVPLSLAGLLLLPGVAACQRGSAGSPPDDRPAGAGVVLVGAGDIADCNRPGREQTALLLDSIAGTIFTTGDNAYPSGRAEDFADCYHPTWGRHKARTRPAPGNHDYRTSGAGPYYRYFGANAGDPTRGYYSYDLGDWHVIVLNSETDMDAGSAQERWLRSDLSANTRACTVAYWHEPRFSSGDRHGSSRSPKPLWSALYEHHADLVLNGHDHLYERFAPQTPDGELDQEHGIRQFTVGTGGRDLYEVAAPLPNSEARTDEVHGVLKLTLFAGSYQWEFVPVEGARYTDAGSGACHDETPLPNNPPFASTGGPYSSEATIRFDASGSSDPEKHVPLQYAWDFGDGTSGNGVAADHTYASNGTYVVTLVVTDALGATGDPDSTVVVIANQPPVVDGGSDVSTNPGARLSLQIPFEDPGSDDAPWGYSIDWGDGTMDSGSVDTQAPIPAQHRYATVGQYQMTVTVTDDDGGRGADSVQVAVVESSPVLVGAGNIARCSNDNAEATARLLDRIPGTVFTLGDNAYETGTTDEYRDCYHPTWGRHKARTRPTIGDTDYDTPAARGYFGYFGSAAGDPDKGYYSYDIGAWHVIVLNSRIGKNPDTPQGRWLRADLAASANMCTLAYFHDALFFSAGSGGSANMRPVWDMLYEAGVEIVLNAERRFYERFAPQSPDGEEDPAWGIRQFVVGTGGWGSNSFGTPLPNSEVRNRGDYGVLKLTLHDASYDWVFVPVDGDTFTDSGSGTCHGRPPNRR